MFRNFSQRTWRHLKLRHFCEDTISAHYCAVPKLGAGGEQIFTWNQTQIFVCAGAWRMVILACPAWKYSAWWLISTTYVVVCCCSHINSLIVFRPSYPRAPTYWPVSHLLFFSGNPKMTAVFWIPFNTLICWIGAFHYIDFPKMYPKPAVRGSWVCLFLVHYFYPSTSRIRTIPLPSTQGNCFRNVLLIVRLLEPHSHMWGQNTLIISSLSPKRHWGPKRVNTTGFWKFIFSDEKNVLYREDRRMSRCWEKDETSPDTITGDHS